MISLIRKPRLLLHSLLSHCGDLRFNQYMFSSSKYPPQLHINQLSNSISTAKTEQEYLLIPPDRECVARVEPRSGNGQRGRQLQQRTNKVCPKSYGSLPVTGAHRDEIRLKMGGTTKQPALVPCGDCSCHFFNADPDSFYVRIWVRIILYLYFF